MVIKLVNLVYFLYEIKNIKSTYRTNFFNLYEIRFFVLINEFIGVRRLIEGLTCLRL